jgi:hypothetical protein
VYTVNKQQRLRGRPQQRTMPRDMSWLSPKRRRTTMPLPTTKNGRKSTSVEEERALSPSPQVQTSSPRPVLPSPDLGQRTSRVFSSASATSESDGNLFYAYARQVCKLKTCRRFRDADIQLRTGRRASLPIPLDIRLGADSKRMVGVDPNTLP